MNRPSVSVVSDVVAPYLRVKIFRNIFAPSNSSGTWAVCA